jgi:multiple antibiotic resistance protein
VVDTVFLISAFVTLFVVIDPIGLVPIYIGLSREMDPAHRRSVARRACLIGLGLLTLFGLFGEAVLNFVGISMPAFRIAGGILLFLTALDMLFERRTQRREGQSANASADDPSVFPLAIPLIAGPGAIASMILLTGEAGPGGAGTGGAGTGGAGPGWQGLLAVHLVMAVVIAMVYVAFLMAPAVERALGRTGVLVVTRLLGMLLAALSVQFIIDGISGAIAAAG